MDIFRYTDEEIKYLKNKDEKLAFIIDEVGVIEREVIKDIFKALIRGVVGQQISTKASNTVWNNLNNKCLTDSQSIFLADINDIKSCGMSMKKAEYIKGIAEAVVNKTINLENLKNLDDEEIINELIKLKGIGIWSAKMVLIFSMERKDVISYEDLIIRKNIIKLYGLSSLNKNEFEVYAKRYSPYATLASLYIWGITNNDIF